MNKYARPIKRSGFIEIVDVIDLDAFAPRPEWGKTDDGLLSGIYKPNKVAWVGAGEWFVKVSDGVQNNAVYASRYQDYANPANYTNPDGSNGNGTLPQPKPVPPPAPSGRDLTSIEFLKIGYGIGLADMIDASLSQMPSLKLLLDQYVSEPGVKFADAQPGADTMVTAAFARMKAAAFITDTDIGNFLAAWVATYPLKT